MRRYRGYSDVRFSAESDEIEKALRQLSNIASELKIIKGKAQTLANNVPNQIDVLLESATEGVRAADNLYAKLADLKKRL